MKRKALLLFLMLALLSGSAWAQNCTEQTITATSSFYEDFDNWSYSAGAHNGTYSLFSDYGEDQNCWYVRSEFEADGGTTTPRIWYKNTSGTIARHLSMKSAAEANLDNDTPNPPTHDIDRPYDNVAALPVFTNPISELTIKFKSKLNLAGWKWLRIGYVNTENNSFHEIKSVKVNSTSLKDYGPYRLSDTTSCPTAYNANYRIAFCFEGTMNNKSYSCDVDDIRVTLSQYTITGNTDGNGTVTVSNDGTCYAGQTATLTATADEGYHFHQWNDGNTDNPRTINVTANATYTAEFTAIPYTITNTTDWVAFCDAVKGGHDYSGKTVTLTNNITISTVAGSLSSVSASSIDGKPFKGTFDGGGHTLTLAITTSAVYDSPFPYIDNATIQNLIVDGTIQGSHKQISALVGCAAGTSNITNCTIGATIQSSVTGDSGIAGVVVRAREVTSTQLTITGCAFTGNFACNDEAYQVTGFVGWRKNSDPTVTLSNCLFKPAGINCKRHEYNRNFVRSGDNTDTNITTNVSITNCYYTLAMPLLNNSYSTQGTQVYALTLVATPTEGGTVTHGTAGQTYNVSTITTYGTGNGLDCGGTFYAPAGNCTLTATPNTNYAFVNWTEVGSPVSTEADYNFTVSADRTLTANFVFALTKEIVGYGTSERGGYYLIASPLADDVDPATVGMITDNLDETEVEANGTYDLYSFDQAQEREWQNYRASTFDLVNGTGYLYASKNGTTLTFSGAPYSGDGIVTLSKTGDVRFSGWNLVGNPFPVRAYPSKTSFYIMNDDGDGIIAVADADPSRNYVEPMEGIFVIANEHGETMTFSTQNPGKKGQIVNVNVTKACSRDAAVIDRAIVRFDEGEGLEKFQLNPKHTKIYIPQNGTDYAVVNADGAGTIPVNFKAQDNGRYTLDFTTEEVSFDYLHLIDNMTGADVDLLATPTYTFNARTTDYASRFKLVFAATGIEENPSTGSGTFAYNNGSEWVIANPSTGSGAEATLQVVDMLGRVLSSETISGSCSKAINVATGVYMLRLINGNDVKVQKIVVRR